MSDELKKIVEQVTGVVPASAPTPATQPAAPCPGIGEFDRSKSRGVRLVDLGYAYYDPAKGRVIPKSRRNRGDK